VRTVKFSVYVDGRWICAAGEKDTIFTQAKNLKKLLSNIDEAVRCHFGIKTGEFKISLDFEPEVLVLLSQGNQGAQSFCC
jgi:hypothetical protein